MRGKEFTGDTPQSEVAAFVDAVRMAPAMRDALVPLLAEQSGLYAGRSTNEAERLRGYVLAAFEKIGLPSAALPYALEELESGCNPYTIAAAARAVRGANELPKNTVALLLGAIDRVSQIDDAVNFETFAAGLEARGPTTALMEVIRTLAWLGSDTPEARNGLAALARASEFSAAARAEIEQAFAARARPAARSTCCCNAEPDGRTGPDAGGDAMPGGDPLDALALQDQGARYVQFGEFFKGRRSIVTFFYTRCENPDKCSSTITKLGALQRRITEAHAEHAFNIAAITYDPAFDHPGRLHAYGTNRGMIFNDRNRLLRTVGPPGPLLQHFGLCVGYGPSTVNRHGLQLFILDDTGRVETAFTRMLWQHDEVFEALRGRRIE